MGYNGLASRLGMLLWKILLLKNDFGSNHRDHWIFTSRNDHRNTVMEN